MATSGQKRPVVAVSFWPIAYLNINGIPRLIHLAPKANGDPQPAKIKGFLTPTYSRHEGSKLLYFQIK